MSILFFSMRGTSFKALGEGISAQVCLIQRDGFGQVCRFNRALGQRALECARGFRWVANARQPEENESKKPRL